MTIFLFLQVAPHVLLRNTFLLLNTAYKQYETAQLPLPSSMMTCPSWTISVNSARAKGKGARIAP